MSEARTDPGAGQTPPSLPEGWMTLGQIAEQYPYFRDIAENPEAAKGELTMLCRATSEGGGMPRPVIGFAPQLARAVLDFYVDLRNGLNPNDVNTDDGRQGRDALDEFAWNTGIGRILGPEKK